MKKRSALFMKNFPDVCISVGIFSMVTKEY